MATQNPGLSVLWLHLTPHPSPGSLTHLCQGISHMCMCVCEVYVYFLYACVCEVYVYFYVRVCVKCMCIFYMRVCVLYV